MTPHQTNPGGAAAGPTEVGPWRTSSYTGNGQNCVEVAPWRTSSYSGNGENCVEVAPWHTSTHSGNGSNCVEVAPSTSGVLLRDTKDHGTGPVLTFTTAQWTAFLTESLTGGPSANGAVVVAHTPTGTTVGALAGDPVLRFTPGEWTAFRDGVRDREFDALAVA